MAKRARGGVAPAGTAVDDAAIVAVREAIASVNGGVSKTEVMEATRISSPEWKTAIGVLLAQGEVIRTRAGGGTRYRLAAEGETA